MSATAAVSLRAPRRRRIIALADVPFAPVEADDATVFPAPRTAFLRAWIDTPGHVGRALVRDGRLAAWGVIRPSRTGCKIGPLVADDRAAAEAVFAALVAAAGGGEIFLDVPSVNRDAVALAGDHGLSPVFETARMYYRPDPSASPRARVRRHDVRTGVIVPDVAVHSGVIPGPPISGLPEIGIFSAQVGNSRLGCAAREPGIHNHRL